MNDTLLGQVALALGETEEARERWARAEGVLRRIVALDETNEDRRGFLYEVVLLRGQQYVRRGALDAARSCVRGLRALTSLPATDSGPSSVSHRIPQAVALEASIAEAEGDAPRET